MPAKRNIGRRENQKIGSATVSQKSSAIKRTKFPPLTGEKLEKYIFKSADAFIEISQQALKAAASSPDEEWYLAIVYCVNGALATELYLKCLLTVEGGQIPKTHNLKFLFSQLSCESRGKIKKRHNELAPQQQGLCNFRDKQGIQIDLDSLLEDGQDVFVTFRYLFEGIADRVKPVGFALELFASLVRNRIIDLRSHWLGDESTSQAR